MKEREKRKYTSKTSSNKDESEKGADQVSNDDVTVEIEIPRGKGKSKAAEKEEKKEDEEESRNRWQNDYFLAPNPGLFGDYLELSKLFENQTKKYYQNEQRLKYKQLFSQATF